MNGFYGIFRTRRMKPAGGGEQKPPRVLVQPDTKYDEIIEYALQNTKNPSLFFCPPSG
jgi:hypothetical protein